MEGLGGTLPHRGRVGDPCRRREQEDDLACDPFPELLAFSLLNRRPHAQKRHRREQGWAGHRHIIDQDLSVLINWNRELLHVAIWKFGVAQAEGMPRADRHLRRCHLQKYLREHETERGKRAVAEQDIQRDPANDTVPIRTRQGVAQCLRMLCKNRQGAGGRNHLPQGSRAVLLRDLLCRQLHREWIEDSSGRLSCFHQHRITGCSPPGRRAMLPDRNIETDHDRPGAAQCGNGSRQARMIPRPASEPDLAGFVARDHDHRGTDRARGPVSQPMVVRAELE